MKKNYVLKNLDLRDYCIGRWVGYSRSNICRPYARLLYSLFRLQTAVVVVGSGCSLGVVVVWSLRDVMDTVSAL